MKQTHRRRDYKSPYFIHFISTICNTDVMIPYMFPVSIFMARIVPQLSLSVLWKYLFICSGNSHCYRGSPPLQCRIQVHRDKSQCMVCTSCPVLYLNTALQLLHLYLLFILQIFIPVPSSENHISPLLWWIWMFVINWRINASFPHGGLMWERG